MFPIPWENHVQRNIRVIFQQLAQTIRPLTLGRNPPQQPLEQSEHRECPAVAQTIAINGRSYRLKDHATAAGKEDKSKKTKSKSNDTSAAEPAS